MFRMIRPSRATVIDVTGGFSEVKKCLASKSTASSRFGSDHDESPVQLEMKRTVGLGLAPDHSDTSHSRFRCTHEGSVKSSCVPLTLTVSLQASPGVHGGSQSQEASPIRFPTLSIPLLYLHSPAGQRKMTLDI